MALQIKIDRHALIGFCRKHYIKKLAFYGSVLRDDFRSNSDIDVLVEFEAEHTPDFFTLFDMEMELSDILDKRKVDIVTYRSLNPWIADEVLRASEVQYAEE